MTAFTVTRSAFIPAAPADVFRHVNDFHLWAAWSPWEDQDTNLEKVYSGSESGAGAKYAWAGKKTGTGNMEIENSVAPAAATNGVGQIDIDLNFVKPFKANNHTIFTFTPEGEGTTVTWAMNGENKTLFSRIFAKLFNMDKAVGGDFEKGLARLRGVVAESA